MCVHRYQKFRISGKRFLILFRAIEALFDQINKMNSSMRGIFGIIYLCQTRLLPD
uniref:Uncharacterized protein n=1 Tax=Kalanchoe fedtschenkoi TaxID=63787 RepID=A0A7N1A6Q4_KALFE